MKALFNIANLSVLILVFCSCKKQVDTTTAPNIYLAGRQGLFAKYWVNGQEKVLNNGITAAIVNSIFVAGKDVYATGNDGDTAKMWKNGIAYNLTDGKMASEANSIFVYNNDVYVAGDERDSITFEFKDKYWKNGIGINTGLGSVKCIMMVDNNLYMITGGGVWKNGIVNKIENGNPYITLRCMTVNGNDIYAGGNSVDPATGKTLAKYWKNGQPFQVSTFFGSEVQGIAVTGSTIHLLINENNEIKYWKNGAVTSISKGGYAYSMAVYENDVYIAGNEITGGFSDRIATYWKNGIRYDLGPGSDKINLRSVFIAKK